MSENTHRIYSPKGPHFKGNIGLFHRTSLMVNELISARELIWRLFIRDFSAKYRQSALGVVWAVLMPLGTVGIFLGMRNAGILTISNVDIPYPLYALIGLTIWNLFTAGLTACPNSLVNAGTMVVKINFPKVALILSASFQGIVEFIIRAVLIAIMFSYFRVVPDPAGVVVGLICLIPIYLITVGLGFLFSLIAGVARDIANVINIALMVIMLVPPVLYPIRGDSLLSRINVWNPFNYFVNVPRDFIIKGHTEFPVQFIIVSIFSAVIFYTGWRLFYLAQTKIAERI